jgi:hypothetical protein
VRWGAVILLKIVKIASFTLLIKTGVIPIIGVCVLKETMKVMLHRMFIIITANVPVLGDVRVKYTKTFD